MVDMARHSTIQLGYYTCSDSVRLQRVLSRNATMNSHLDKDVSLPFVRVWSDVSMSNHAQVFPVYTEASTQNLASS